MKAIKGRLRVVGLGEADRVLAFYRQNSHRFLLPRPEAQFQNAVTRGNFLLVEIGAKIVAASGIFDYSDAEPYVELAETSVTKAVQGHGLQALFFRHRIASVVVSQGPSVVITTAVDPGNDFSVRNVSQLGFQPWRQPIPEAYLSCPQCRAKPASNSGRKCCCDFYYLPIEKARGAVSAALLESESSELTLMRKAPGLVLSSECLFLKGAYREMLRDFVEGRDW
jgi:hypothetical protein